MMHALRELEINGGRVDQGDTYHLVLPETSEGYADAQLDDYGGLRRKNYLWHQGTRMELRARFSHEKRELVGTAGFGFWNAPFGDPTMGLPALPKAAWFFFASEQSNLPLALSGAGRGWFASTLDSTRAKALVLAPLAPFFILLNNSSRVRRLLWPFIRDRLEISYQEVPVEIDKWHSYRLCWMVDGCEFWVDGKSTLRTTFSPAGPMGFVCWIDNQYLVASPSGRFRWGTIPVAKKQWLEVSDLNLAAVESC
jgi:hypothetical protein